MSEIKYEIIKQIGVLSKAGSGWSKELNLISWNDREPKYDIRDWSADGQKMGKGVTLSNSLPEEPEGLELTKETPPAQKPVPARSSETASPLVEQVIKRHENLEEIYPGITEQIRLFVEAELPSCSHCGSEDTASVQVGTVGRAAVIGKATKKVKLVPTAKDKLGTYFCNNCGKYFN
jgi:hypothetical protein